MQRYGIVAAVLVSVTAGPCAWGVTFYEYAVTSYFAHPSAITLAGDGALWFTDFGGGKIGRINTAGPSTEDQPPTLGSAPAGIAAGPYGAVWLTESSGKKNKTGRVTTAGAFTD